MVRISNYSRDALTDLLAEVDLDFDLREQGTLQLFRTEKQLKGSKADQEVLAEYDSPFEVLDRDGCIAVEPGLAHVADKFVGGLRLTADRTGDCRMFTLALADKAAGIGVSLPLRGHHRGASPARASGSPGSDRPRASSAPTPMSSRSGPTRRSCCAAIGIRLPIYPIKGYSITLPVTDDAAAPQSTLMDETHKVAITRLGDRIRVAGPGRDHRLQRQLGRTAPPTPSAMSSPTCSRRAATSRRPRAGPASGR